MQAHSWYTCRGGEGEEEGCKLITVAWFNRGGGGHSPPPPPPPPTRAALLHNPLASLKLCWTINTHHSQSALLSPLPFWMKLPRASPPLPYLCPPPLSYLCTFLFCSLYILVNTPLLGWVHYGSYVCTLRVENISSVCSLNQCRLMLLSNLPCPNYCPLGDGSSSP